MIACLLSDTPVNWRRSYHLSTSAQPAQPHVGLVIRAEIQLVF